MGTFYRSRHELIFAFKNGSAPHLNNFELGQHGRYRTNVWQYRGVKTVGAGRLEELALHPTVKPVQMVADAIKDVSARRGIVLDLFGGSGSTLIAAHKTGRRGYLCEYDPIYCDRILRRWEIYAKTTPNGSPPRRSPAGHARGWATPKRKPNFERNTPRGKRVRYDVGYGKPPEATRFKPGISGNPKGRPKGAGKKTRYTRRDLDGLDRGGALPSDIHGGRQRTTRNSSRASVVEITWS